MKLSVTDNGRGMRDDGDTLQQPAAAAYGHLEDRRRLCARPVKNHGYAEKNARTYCEHRTKGVQPTQQIALTHCLSTARIPFIRS